MLELKEIIVIVAQAISGIITTTVIPLVIKRFITKKLSKKIDEIQSSDKLDKIHEDIKEIKKEILQMRGKIK